MRDCMTLLSILNQNWTDQFKVRNCYIYSSLILINAYINDNNHDVFLHVGKTGDLC